MVVVMSVGIEGKTWVVGDAQGWSAMDYSAWLQGKVFAVGDELVFPYRQGAQDVAEVSQGDYETCNGVNPLNLWIDGDVHVKLTTKGSKYYICTFPGHCPPLRLAINVVATNSTIVPSGQVGTDANTIASISTKTPPSPINNRNNTNNAGSTVVPLLHYLLAIVLSLFSVWALFS
ncbi:hypothetical protein GOP47_0007422 [Adiantum capillus-veneris]|nr:hypothetical protein GOP47_0007422 [Adiantum capillus-veneris]